MVEVDHSCSRSSGHCAEDRQWMYQWSNTLIVSESFESFLKQTLSNNSCFSLSCVIINWTGFILDFWSDKMWNLKMPPWDVLPINWWVMRTKSKLSCDEDRHELQPQCGSQALGCCWVNWSSWVLVPFDVLFFVHFADVVQTGCLWIWFLSRRCVHVTRIRTYYSLCWLGNA